MNATLLSILPLIPDFLRAVASAFNGTSLAGAIVPALNTGAALVEAGDVGATELKALTDQIKAMVTAGRDPTEDEWNALKARSDAAHAIIQGLSTPPSTSAADPSSSPTSASTTGSTGSPT